MQFLAGNMILLVGASPDSRSVSSPLPLQKNLRVESTRSSVDWRRSEVRTISVENELNTFSYERYLVPTGILRTPSTTVYTGIY